MASPGYGCIAPRRRESPSSPRQQIARSSSRFPSLALFLKTPLRPPYGHRSPAPARTLRFRRSPPPAMASPNLNPAGDGGGGDEEPASLEDLYHLNVVPSELFLKFRKEAQGFRLGLNLEFYNFQGNEYQAKLVLKPLAPDRRWKFVYEPIHGDIRVLSKKIPITKYLNLQVGVGHNYHLNAIGWKWKLSTCLGGDGVSQIRNKTSIGLFPGFDLRIGWRAEYILPEIHGSVGTGEPIFNMSYGRLHASIDRVEAILTHES